MNESVGAVSLKCANCGASLQVPPDVEILYCSYCGVPQQIHRSDGQVLSKLLEQGVREVERTIERAVAEQAAAGRVAAEQAAADEVIGQLREERDKIDDQLNELRTSYKATPKLGAGCSFLALVMIVTGALPVSRLILEGDVLTAILPAIVFWGPVLLFACIRIQGRKARFRAMEQPLVAKRDQLATEILQIQQHLAEGEELDAVPKATLRVTIRE